MKREGKILLTDIKAGRDTELSTKKYFDNLSTAFLNYSVTKLSLNYFTLKEMAEAKKAEYKTEFDTFLSDIDTEISNAMNQKETDIEKILKIRESITGRMRVLTAYTDAFEIYEYILNRKEGTFMPSDDEEVDIYDLAARMYEFVFSDNDKVIVNSKIQSFVAQLPVRMTKQRFYDIISASLDIYKGGERKSVDDFALSIENAACISMPDGFEALYPDLYKAYRTLKEADYKELRKEEFEELSGVLSDATEIINENVTDFLMLQEIVNDTLIMLYSMGHDIDSDKLPESYNSACTIIKGIAECEDIYEAAVNFDKLFVNLEGAQEDAYETLSFLVSGLYEIREGYMEDASDENVSYGNMLVRCDLLTSNSLFADIEAENNDTPFRVVNETADADYIKGLKDRLAEEFDKVFAEVSKVEKRSIMAKVLALVPVFFNSQQEIKDYFEYTLSRCNDKDELLCCSRLIEEIMED